MVQGQAQTGLCSHGVSALNPLGTCEGCRDEVKVVCRVGGCTDAPYAGARNRLAGLCFEHYVEASERAEANRSLRYDAAVASDRAAVAAQQFADDRGGA